VSFAREREILAIGGEQLVTVFDLRVGGTLAKLARTGRVRCAILSSEGDAVLVGGFDKKASLLNIRAGAQLQKLPSEQELLRSVHMVRDLIAVGCESKDGMGCTLLYAALAASDEVSSATADGFSLLHKWEHTKAVWTARISRCATLLAAGGFDMALSLYSCKTYQLLQKISYPPVGGPAFIWSCDWSGDGEHLLVGCWNSRAYLYEVDRGLASSPMATKASWTAGKAAVALMAGPKMGGGGEQAGSAPEPLTEIATVQRSDRVYAVALDAMGRALVIGGRDKKLARFDLQTSDGSVKLRWEVTAEDFIYAVAASPLMHHVACGGPFKAVLLLDGRNGVQIAKLHFPGVIWAVTLAELPTGPVLAVGGECPVITVLDIETQSDVLQMPVSETTFDICVTTDSLCFTEGKDMGIFGSISRYGWRDHPAFEVISSVMISLLSSEDQLLRCMRLILGANPAVVNSRSPVTGSTLVHFAVHNSSNTHLLEALLSADCKVGLAPDKKGRSPLEIAIEGGKWGALKLLLKAVQDGRFLRLPGSMKLVSAVLPQLARKYPLDFLSFLSHFGLEPEPEILSEKTSSDVMLPRMLVVGSYDRCPKGIWTEKLVAFTQQRLEEEDELSHKSKKGAKPKSIGDTILSGIELDLDSHQTIAEQVKQALRKHRGRVMELFEQWDTDGDGQISRKEFHAAMPRLGLRGVSEKDTQVLFDQWGADADEDGDGTLSFTELHRFLTMRNEADIEVGFLRQAHASLEPVRVCLENFAGVPDDGSPCALKLIVEAVGKTGDYSVFGAQLLEILIDFKWRGFARRRFLIDFISYLLHVLAMTLYNVVLANVSMERFLFFTSIPIHAQSTFAEIIDALTTPGDNQNMMIAVCVGWAFTTLRAMTMGIRTAMGFWASGLGFFDLWSSLDIVYIIGQLTVNTIFWARTNNHTGLILSEDVQDATVDGAVRRQLRTSAASGGLSPDIEWTGYIPGFFLAVQAIVIFASWVRTLFFFRGFLRLGALVHSMVQIAYDIVPLLCLCAVFLPAFGFAMWVLVQAEIRDVTDWYDPLKALYGILNAGLYTYYDVHAFAVEASPMLLVLYEVFMLMMQIILLNMLIAIMNNSHQKVNEVSRLVAMFERGKIILRYEQGLVASRSKKNRRQHHDPHRRPQVKSQRDKWFMDKFPRYLHVVLPKLSGVGSTKLEDETERLRETRDRVTRLATELADAREETRRMLTLLQTAQEDSYQGILARFESFVNVDSGLKSARGVLRNVSARESDGPGLEVPSLSVQPLTSWLFGPKKQQDGSISARSPRVGAASAAALAPTAEPSDSDAPSLALPAPMERTSTGAIERAAAPFAAPANAAKPEPINVHKLSKAESRRIIRVLEDMKREGGATPLPQTARLRQDEARASPAPGVLSVAMRRFKSDTARCKKMAMRMRDRDYCLREYHDDIRAAFGEIYLYLVAVRDEDTPAPPEPGGSAPTTTRKAMLQARAEATAPDMQNRTEYQRTIGAFFALYWLMRIGIDGEDGFCFGVDSDWNVLGGRLDEPFTVSPEGKLGAVAGNTQLSFFAMTPLQKENAFRNDIAWDKLRDLLRDAGLLRLGSGRSPQQDQWEVVPGRVASMLVLTAIHDIMKIESLLPRVQPEHAPYNGFRAHDVINDHDVALGYVLDHYGSLLPSYAALPKHEQASIRFTQSKIGFNHGWLVQGEAPPGALFSKFKSVLQSENAPPTDVAFYFVHWLTDLAGAEPTPLRGSQKFVQRFPHAVLASFIDSFSVVNKLAVESETSIFEQYLVQRWGEVLKLGPAPEGENSIALMRLSTQVQSLPLQLSLPTAFTHLPAEDLRVLCDEMAMTGIEGQAYRRYVPPPGGPAFLVYYAPAFLRTNTAAEDRTLPNLVTKLRMLAEVYRQARNLWPLSTSAADYRSVTLRIDVIKDATIESINDSYSWGEVYVLQKSNENEGRVDKQPLYTLAAPPGDSSERALLAFWRQEDIQVQIDDETLVELEQANNLLLSNSKKASITVSC